MLKAVFEFEKETKNAWRYRAKSNQPIPAYNTLYIVKIDGKSAPATIDVAISMSEVAVA
jgi:hypothetical protein